MPLLQELNKILTELGGILTGTGATLKGYSIFFSEEASHPQKSDYPWVDIMALDMSFDHDVTRSLDIKVQVVFRIYSKATGASSGKILDDQDALNDVREEVLELLFDNAHGTDYYMQFPSRASRLYLDKDSKAAGVCDIYSDVSYRRRP